MHHSQISLRLLLFQWLLKCIFSNSSILIRMHFQHHYHQELAPHLHLNLWDFQSCLMMFLIGSSKCCCLGQTMESNNRYCLSQYLHNRIAKLKIQKAEETKIRISIILTHQKKVGIIHRERCLEEAFVSEGNVSSSRNAL